MGERTSVSFVCDSACVLFWCLFFGELAVDERLGFYDGGAVFVVDGGRNCIRLGKFLAEEVREAVRY